MKKLLIFILLLSSSIFAEKVEIKGIKTYSNTSKVSLPVLIKDGNEKGKIFIEFDVISEHEPDLEIKFEFCDKNWNPMESIFFTNEGFNKDNLITLDHVNNPSGNIYFHFRKSYPNENVTFPFSGKWIYTINDKFSGEIFGEGRFYVVEQTVGISAKLSKETVESPSISDDVPDRSFRLEITGAYGEEILPHYLQEAEIITNHLTDFPKVITVNDHGLNNYFETDANNNFTFISRDIFPGNEYRRLDIRDHSKYPAPIADHKFGDLDITRIFKAGKQDLNGGSNLIKYNDRYAEYIDVTFRFDVPSEYEGDIYLAGSFNDWIPIEMYKEEGLYKAVVNIKRGVYDYQYLKLMDEENWVFDWFLFEGNFWETKNEYHIFIYAHSDDYGGYDKIIGYLKK